MTSTTTPTERPRTPQARVTNLDAIRGIAALAILAMNGVAFFLPTAAYTNLDAAGSDTWLDHLIGIAGEIFVDEKGMALFSMLFGVGIVIFAERAAAKGRRPVWLSLWRNVLLLVIGIAHTLLWEGDILVVYAMAAPIILALRRLPIRWAAGVGTAMLLASCLTAVATQSEVGPAGEGLGTFWFIDPPGTGTVGDDYFVIDGALRTLALMLIGIALYRSRFLHGEWATATYRRIALLGLGAGWALAGIGVAIQYASDFDPAFAIVGEIPNTIALIPATLGASAAIILWNQRGETGATRRIRAVGQMALTNYVSATVLGLVVVESIMDTGGFGRTEIFVFVLAVWALQVMWSAWWLDRFRFGPIEWLWRCGTYRSLQPLRR